MTLAPRQKLSNASSEYRAEFGSFADTKVGELNTNLQIFPTPLLSTLYHDFVKFDKSINFKLASTKLLII